MKKISVVIPVYNVANVIEDVIESFQKDVVSKLHGSEFIVVEDGSTDGSKEKIAKLQKKYHFRFISGEKRKGYVKAFKDAMKLPKNEIVFFSDSDGEYNPKDFWKLIDYIDDYDIVVGCRENRKIFHRVIVSRMNNFFIFLLFGIKMRDSNSPFRLVKKNVINDIIDDVGMTIHPGSESVVRAKKKGYKVIEVPVRHYKTESEFFSFKKFPKIVLKTIFGLIKLRLKLW